MGLRTVHECDVCSNEPQDGDLSAWRRVTISMLQPQAPVVEVPGVAPPAAPPPVESYMVCHKPSCLTKLAKKANEGKLEPPELPPGP